MITQEQQTRLDRVGSRLNSNPNKQAILARMKEGMERSTTYTPTPAKTASNKPQSHYIKPATQSQAQPAKQANSSFDSVLAAKCKAKSNANKEDSEKEAINKARAEFLRINGLA